jgi:hypothetical protein
MAIPSAVGAHTEEAIHNIKCCCATVLVRHAYGPQCPHSIHALGSQLKPNLDMFNAKAFNLHHITARLVGVTATLSVTFDTMKP